MLGENSNLIKKVTIYDTESFSKQNVIHLEFTSTLKV